MAQAYTTWTKVKALYPRADDVESDAGNQTTLIQAKSDELAAYLRGITSTALQLNADGAYDEVVQMATAQLVIEELRQRRITDDTELYPREFEHLEGVFTHNGVLAHGLIQGLRRGTVKLDQQADKRDAQYPEASIVTQTGTGSLVAFLPTKQYESWTRDVYRILVTGAGRADVESATFSWWRNYDAAEVATGVSVSEDPIHLAGGLYVQWQDGATTGTSFAVNDEWLITAVPTMSETLGGGPSGLEFFSG